MMPQLSTPSSRFYLPRWALPHIPNHDDPTDQILFFDPTNKAPPAKATPRDALHHSGREVLHDHHIVRGSVFDRTLQTSPAKAAAVAVNELELSALIFKGYLPEEDRNDAEAIKAAIEGVISDIAFDLQQGTSTRSGSPL
jgi:hypothetical protein